MAINSQNGSTLLTSGFFPPVRVATTGGNLILSGLQIIDGVALAPGDRVLVKDQTDPTTNGIYSASTGVWPRSSDASGNQQFFDGMATLVAQGAANAATIFICTCADDPVTIGASLLTFASQSALATAGQQATSTTSLAVGTGAKTLAIQAGKSFLATQWVLIYETATPANAMLAQVTSYSGTALVVSVSAIGGSGTHADWTVVLANSVAAAGLQPPLGSGNVTGPGSSTAGHVPTFADTTGKLLQDSGIALGTLAGRTALLYGDAGTATIPQSALSPGAAPLPFVAAQPADNLRLSNDSTNPTRDVGVSPGRVRDDSDATNLQLAGAMVKRLDQIWAAGGVAGGPVGALDTGSRAASKTYHWYLIGNLGQSVTSVSRTSNVATLTVAAHGLGVGGTVRAFGIGSGFDAVAVITAVTTNTISYANTGSNVGATAAAGFADGFDILASLNYNSPALPSGWTVKQCLGSTLTDSTPNNLAFTQFADVFVWSTFKADVIQTPGNLNLTAAVLETMSLPQGVSVEGIFNATIFDSSSGAVDLLISDPAIADQVPAATNGLSTARCTNTAACVQARCFSDVLGRIRLRTSSSPSDGACWVSTRGWRDPRRRLF